MKILSRSEIEEKIISKSESIDITKPYNQWAESKEFYEFSKAWDDLVKYYTNNPQDSEIGIEVIREYLFIAKLLIRLILDEDANSSKLSDIKDTLNSLNFQLDEIIREVVTFKESRNNK